MVNRSANAPNSRQLQTKHLTTNRKALRKSCQVGVIRLPAIRVGLALVLNQNGIRNKMTWRNVVKQNIPMWADGTAEARKWIKMLRKGICNHSYGQLIELIRLQVVQLALLLRAQDCTLGHYST